MQQPPKTYNPAIAHITHTDGSIFQVLNADGTDWDEPATAVSYAAYLASLSQPE